MLLTFIRSAGKGLYLTVHTLSRPSMDTVQYSLKKQIIKATPHIEHSLLNHPPDTTFLVDQLGFYPMPPQYESSALTITLLSNGVPDKGVQHYYTKLLFLTPLV